LGEGAFGEVESFRGLVESGPLLFDLLGQHQQGIAQIADDFAQAGNVGPLIDLEQVTPMDEAARVAEDVLTNVLPPKHDGVAAEGTFRHPNLLAMPRRGAKAAAAEVYTGPVLKNVEGEPKPIGQLAPTAAAVTFIRPFRAAAS
jgi:hypothetical protein